MQHQYIERDSGNVCSERLFGDQLIRLLYHGARENAPILFRLLTSSWSSSLLGVINFDLPLPMNRKFIAECGVNLVECVDPPESLNTPRKIFERKIRYEEFRPMAKDDEIVVSPADARVLVGSFRETSALFLKDKFFSYEELLGRDQRRWLDAFDNGDFAVFRLTPDKYHFNHTPVAGRVVDIYAIDGDYNSCNPSAIVSAVTPYSKNKRVVTILDTDVPRGTGAGLVAMIEVVALMIGDIVQCYSRQRYDAPQPVELGMFLEKGQPKSLYRPGSSTDILIFQADRVRFFDDIVNNMNRAGVASRFTQGFNLPLVETDVKVRSAIAMAVNNPVSR